MHFLIKSEETVLGSLLAHRMHQNEAGIFSLLNEAERLSLS